MGSKELVLSPNIWLFMIEIMHPKDNGDVANSEYSDQTAPLADGFANSVNPELTDLGLPCLPRPIC